MDDKERAELDQQTALVADLLVPLWRRLYINCIKEEFTELESMELVKTYIMSQGSGK